MIRDCVENVSSLKCQRDARTSTEISNVLVESDIEVSVARYRHPDDTDPDHETDVIQEADHEVAVHVVVVEMMDGEHFMTNQLIRSTGHHRRQNGVLRSITFLHDAAGKT